MRGVRFRAPFDKTEELRLLRLYKLTRAPDLEERLVAAYVPLVTSVAKKVYTANKRYLIDVDELISAGYEGLLTAFRQFDPDRGFRFATYAAWWILPSVITAVKTERWIIGISDYRYRDVMNVVRAIHHLEQEFGHRPNEAEISAHLKKPAAKITRLLAWLGRQAISLDTPVGHGSSTIADFIADNRTDPPIVALENNSTLLWIMTCLEGLTERERQVLHCRFGLFGNEVFSVGEIAKRLNVTTSGVRYIQSRALEKLRRRMSAEKRSPRTQQQETTPKTTAA